MLMIREEELVSFKTVKTGTIRHKMTVVPSNQWKKVANMTVATE